MGPLRTLRHLFKLLRPHQWLKNGFVYIGILFDKRWGPEAVVEASGLFIAFSAAASAVYALNDVLDAPSDRRHPDKRRRPVASGTISRASALGAAAVLAGLSLALGARVSRAALGILATYVVINVLYSLRLKHIPVLDVFIIAAGFMLRILVGTVGLGIPPSHWLLLTALALTLFLGFAKRRAELALHNAADSADPYPARHVLAAYELPTLDLFLGITAACTILSYGLYAVSPDTLAKHGTRNLFYTLPFVIYGIFRYLLLVHRRRTGPDVASDLLTDSHLLVTIVAWVLVTLAVLWSP